MKDLQGPQVLLGSRDSQAAAFSPKETQVQMDFLDYRVVREMGAPRGLLGLRATLVFEGQKVTEVLRVPVVLPDPKVR